MARTAGDCEHAERALKEFRTVDDMLAHWQQRAILAEGKLDQVRLALATYEREKDEPGRRPDSTLATIDRIVGKKWITESNPK